MMKKKNNRASRHYKSIGWATLMLTLAFLNLSFATPTANQDDPLDAISLYIVSIINDVDLSRNAGAILQHYNLKENDFEYNEWTPSSRVVVNRIENSPEEYIYTDATLENVWVDNQFNANASAPKEYVIQICFGYNDNVTNIYEAIYKGMAKYLSKGEKVDFEHNGKDVLCYYDQHGFKITVGKDLEPYNYDEMEELGL